MPWGFPQLLALTLNHLKHRLCLNPRLLLWCQWWWLVSYDIHFESFLTYFLQLFFPPLSRMWNDPDDDFVTLLPVVAFNFARPSLLPLDNGSINDANQTELFIPFSSFFVRLEIFDHRSPKLCVAVADDGFDQADDLIAMARGCCHCHWTCVMCHSSRQMSHERQGQMCSEEDRRGVTSLTCCCYWRRPVALKRRPTHVGTHTCSSLMQSQELVLCHSVSQDDRRRETRAGSKQREGKETFEAAQSRLFSTWWTTSSLPRVNPIWFPACFAFCRCSGCLVGVFTFSPSIPPPVAFIGLHLHFCSINRVMAWKCVRSTKNDFIKTCQMSQTDCPGRSDVESFLNPAIKWQRWASFDIQKPSRQSCKWERKRKSLLLLSLFSIFHFFTPSSNFSNRKCVEKESLATLICIISDIKSTGRG